MNLLKLNKDEIELIKCTYGNGKYNVDVSQIIKDFIKKKINKNIYFFKFKINNRTLKCDPVPNKIKNFELIYNDHKISIVENQDLLINIKLSFDIIFKNQIWGLKLDKFKMATIFGKGPTFKDIEKKKKELRCAINQASNLASNVDFVCMNDLHNIYKINLDTYTNLKYLLIPQYFHVNQSFSEEGYFINVLKYLDEKFYGKLIVYNLMTSNIKTPYFISLDTAQSSGNNCFEFIGKYTNIKNINIYGMGIFNKKNIYHKDFIGNGKYSVKCINEIVKDLERSSSVYNLKYVLN